MTNELADPRKIQLQKVIALKHMGFNLKSALKKVGMPYTTFRRVLAAYPNVLADLILKGYEIELNEYIQVISKRKEILQDLSAKSDTSGIMTIEDLHALDKCVAEIRAEMKSQSVELTRSHVEESPGKSEAEIYLEPYRNRNNLHEPTSRNVDVADPSPDETTGNAVEGSN